MRKEKRLLFVYNAHAGTGRIRTQLAEVVDIFVKAGYEVIAYPTQGRGDAIRAVLEKEGDVGLVVCCGGDGTLDEVVRAMADWKRKVPVGYLPAGSTNDFAASLGIPFDLLKAARVAVRGKDFACDIGVMNGANFVYIAAFGLFTEVSYGTSQEAKNLIGHVAYVLEGVRALSEIRSYRMRVWDSASPAAVGADGRATSETAKSVIEADFIFGMVTNSNSVGGIREITGKNVALDDGVFEVTLIRMPGNPIDLGGILAALANRDIASEFVYRFKTDHLVIEAEEKVAWTRDGEFGGEHTRVEISNESRGIIIRVPGKAGASAS